MPDRRCADTIFAVLRPGCQWGALRHTDLCAKSTAYGRFRAWVEAGVFLKHWAAGVEQFAALHGSDWQWLSMGRATTKAPLGGDETGRNPTDRGKQGVKRSLLTEGHGVPIGLAIDGAHRHDLKLARPTLEGLVAERPEATEEAPQGMCLDKGYNDDEVRAILREFGFTAHSRARGEEAKALTMDAGKRARRWVVECSHSWMHRSRRILVRWDKRPEHDLALLHCAGALIALRAAGVLG